MAHLLNFELVIFYNCRIRIQSQQCKMLISNSDTRVSAAVSCISRSTGSSCTGQVSSAVCYQPRCFRGISTDHGTLDFQFYIQYTAEIAFASFCLEDFYAPAMKKQWAFSVAAVCQSKIAGTPQRHLAKVQFNLNVERNFSFQCCEVSFAMWTLFSIEFVVQLSHVLRFQ